MTASLYVLAEKAKQQDREAMYDFLQKFEPFIQKSLSQTKPQNREDLRQDLRLKCIECVHRFEPGRTPGFFEFVNTIEHNQK